MAIVKVITVNVIILILIIVIVTFIRTVRKERHADLLRHNRTARSVCSELNVGYRSAISTKKERRIKKIRTSIGLPMRVLFTSPRKLAAYLFTSRIKIS